TIERVPVPPVVAEIRVTSAADDREAEPRRGGGQRRRKAQLREVEAIAGCAPPLDVAGPVKPRVQHGAGIEGIDVVHSGAPVRLDQQRPGRNVAEYLVSGMVAIIVAEVMEELVPAADVEIDAAQFAVER